MSQLVVVSLGAGNLKSGFPAVSVQLWEAEDSYPIKFGGQLPPAPEIVELYRSWQLLYEALHHRLDLRPRIKINAADVTNVSQVEFNEVCQQLSHQINLWLNSESFRSIDQPLRTRLKTNDEIRLLIETNDRLLQRLPWQLWNFFEAFPNAEVALSAPYYQRSFEELQRKSRSCSKEKARILAIFGNSCGIDLEQDRALLSRLSIHADIEFLIEPQREQLNDRLWQQWDMLFFAGHSFTREQGVIQINSTDSLMLEQLQYALKHAIAQGLKLAIFNSCDGIGLAEQLAELNIPQVIVMREPIADRVAHTFLQHFLATFASGKSLYRSVRESRERLQGLEDQYPCAAWLPVIYQNPAIAPTTWRDWSQSNPSLLRRLRSPLLMSIAVTALVIGVRWLGLLQPWELQAFDHLLRSRPSEKPDQRLLVVTITEEDFQLPEQQRREGSLSDLALTRLLDKLEPHQPRTIGLDIYRDAPVRPDQKALAERLGRNDRFFAICKVRESATNHPGIKPPTIPVERQGFSDVVKDPDGVLRRHLLAMQPSPTSPCTTPYALSAQLAFHYLEKEGISARYNPDGNLQLGNVVFEKLRSRYVGYQQIDAWGYQILLNYRMFRSSLDIAPTVTLSEVLAGKVNPAQIKDRIVLIGVVAQSAHDYIPTPYSAASGAYQEMPGVIVQAQLLSQILSAVQDQRSLLRGWPAPGEIVWILGWAVMGSLIAGRRLRYLVLATGFSLGGLFLLCFILLINGFWVPLVPSALAFLGTSTCVIVWRSSQARTRSSMVLETQKS